MEEVERAEIVAKAVSLLRAGEVVALPTETVYGLAGDATRADAVAKIFEAKNRPFFDPLIVHLPDLQWLNRIATIGADEATLIGELTARFWPGPLTIVLPRTGVIPDITAAGLPTVAVRMSAHPLFREVIEGFGGPLAAPSANRFGRISPTSRDDVAEELGGRVPLIVDGGSTPHGLESTIIMVTGRDIEILRHGPVTEEMLAECGRVVAVGEQQALSAPGQMKSHYAPRTPLRIVRNAAEVRVPEGARYGLAAWNQPAPATYVAVEAFSERQDLREAATRLFSVMRKLDALKLDLIVVEQLPEKGLGRAIMERLRKAAHE